MHAVLSAMDRASVAVRSADVDWSGRQLLAHAAGAGRILSGLAPPGTVLPALLSASPLSMALTLGGAFTDRPLAPLGTRLAVAELAPLVIALDAPVLFSDAPNADLAREVGEASATPIVVVDDVADEEPSFAPTRPDSVVLVLHTSGTTGRPKAVRVRDEAVFHRAGAYQAEMGLAGDDLYCSTGGFHHTGGVGMLFVAVASGAGIVPFPRFSVDAWRAVASLRPTCALLVPTMIDLLLEHSALAAVALRGLHYGTAPIHPETLRAALAALPGTRFTQAYGMTEGGPISMLGHDAHLRALAGEDYLLATVGRPLANVELRLDEPTDDGVGEVVARAGQIFQPDPDGWLRTGDLGRLDGEGFLYLQGRRGDKIIRGGENVYPLEVERVLETHRGVAEAAVIGVEDRRWGQTLKAFVVAADPGRPPSPEVLADHARASLAPFKVPTDWELIDALPRNPAGKLLRHRLG